MTKTKAAGLYGPNRRSLTRFGALAGAVGVVLVMPFFYPLGRVFDPTIGGDAPNNLLIDLVLGFVGGVLMSPVAAVLGGGFAFLLNGRRIGPFAGAALVAFASGLAVALWSALGGGFADHDGPLALLMWVALLGGLAGLVAVVFYTQAQRFLVASGTAGAPAVGM